MGLGWVLDSEAGYPCFDDDPRTIRKPDERIPEGHIRIPPDLAVEVVSPNDTAYEVDAKVQEYLSAVVPLVWVVNPQTRSVHIYQGSGPVQRLQEDDELWPMLSQARHQFRRNCESMAGQRPDQAVLSISRPRMVPVLEAKRSASIPKRWRMFTKRFGRG